MNFQVEGVAWVRLLVACSGGDDGDDDGHTIVAVTTCRAFILCCTYAENSPYIEGVVVVFSYLLSSLWPPSYILCFLSPLPLFTHLTLGLKGLGHGGPQIDKERMADQLSLVRSM